MGEAGWVRAVGVISGTSMDAIDVALVDTDGETGLRPGPVHQGAYPPEAWGAAPGYTSPVQSQTHGNAGLQHSLSVGSTKVGGAPQNASAGGGSQSGHAKGSQEGHGGSQYGGGYASPPLGAQSPQQFPQHYQGHPAASSPPQHAQYYHGQQQPQQHDQQQAYYADQQQHDQRSGSPASGHGAGGLHLANP